MGAAQGILQEEAEGEEAEEKGKVEEGKVEEGEVKEEEGWEQGRTWWRWAEGRGRGGEGIEMRAF